MKNIVVVSLFDGLSGAKIALDRVKSLNVARYYSSEIDKYAIQVADYNHPQDTKYRLGDITKIDGVKLLREIHTDFGTDVDILLIGGSPCQGFSMAGKMKGSSTKCGKDVTTLKQYKVLKEMDFEFDGQSYLFWEYIRIRDELKPNYFMLENVKITKKWLPMFNDAMGVEPILINSASVSAQNRQRYYWCNWDVKKPNDKGLIIKDILEDENDDTKKQILSEKAMEFMNSVVKDKSREKAGLKFKTRWEHCNINKDNGKAYTLTASMHKGVPHNVTIIKNREPKVLNDDSFTYRKLTPKECERLQTIDDDYTLTGIDTNQKEVKVSNSQRYKMVGNGFTIDVISHILSYM